MRLENKRAFADNWIKTSPYFKKKKKKSVVTTESPVQLQQQRYKAAKKRWAHKRKLNVG